MNARIVVSIKRQILDFLSVSFFVKSNKTPKNVTEKCSFLRKLTHVTFSYIEYSSFARRNIFKQSIFSYTKVTYQTGKLVLLMHTQTLMKHL